MAVGISVLDEMASQGLLDPEQINVLRAKKQDLEAQDAIRSGIPWWKAKGGQTTWYSGNKPETSNDQFIKETGGPSYEQTMADERNRGLGPNKNTQASRDDYAQWQKSQEPGAPIEHVINKLSGMSPDQVSLYQTQQSQIRKNNLSGAKVASDKSAADYAATPEGTINNAKMIMRRLGIPAQQAMAIATANGNPGIDPAGMNAAAVMPNFAMGNANNNARLGIANVNADVAKAGQANQLAVQGLANEGNIAGINAQGQNAMGVQDQRNKASILQAMIAQGLIPNDMGGGQVAPPPNPMGAKIPPALGPKQGAGPWWNQTAPQGGAPGFTRLPPSPQQQIMLDQAKQQSELGGLQIQNERNKQNPSFGIDQQAAQRVAQLKAQENDPAFVFSEANAEPIRAALVRWNNTGEPLPVSIESGLRSLYNRDIYDSDNKHLGNLFGLVGAGGYTEGNDAQIFADYLETHYGVPQQVGIKLYNEKIKQKPTVSTGTT